MKSKKPSKQRKALHQAPLHKRQKLIAAHLSKPLIKQWGTRSLGVRKGDEVKIIRGDFKGKTGKIIRVDLKKLKVYIDGVKKKKVSGEEYQVPFHPSNLIIINPLVDDTRRKVIITRRGGKVKESETKKTSSA
jgi:large subunit ribosomal protein L24